MNPVLGVLAQFQPEAEPSGVCDTLADCTAELSLQSICALDVGLLSSALAGFPKRDIVTLDVTIGETDPVAVTGASLTNVEEFVNELSSVLGVREVDESIRIGLKIAKGRDQGCMSIYFEKPFIDHLCSIPLQQCTEQFSEILSDSPIAFQSLEGNLSGRTESILFFPEAGTNSPKKEWPATRRTRFTTHGEACHFENAAQIRLLPCDFHWLDHPPSEKLACLFDRLCVVFCATTIFDFTAIREDLLVYRLTGYKTRTGESLFSDISSVSAEEYFRIYKWVYSGGDLSDKIGLARNVISLHLDDDRIFTLTGSCFDSLRSGYEIYLKRNIEQYIAVKNKLSEFILDLSAKANAISDAFVDSFQKSFLAFVSFFVASVLTQLIAGKSLQCTLPSPVAACAWVLLAISFGHLCLAKCQVERKRKRHQEEYTHLKHRYKDLLHEDDLVSIFADDQEFRDADRFVSEQVRNYAGFWLGIIVVSAILVGIFKDSGCVAKKQAPLGGEMGGTEKIIPPTTNATPDGVGSNGRIPKTTGERQHTTAPSEANGGRNGSILDRIDSGSKWEANVL